jgi:hypothetical protein
VDRFATRRHHRQAPHTTLKLKLLDELMESVDAMRQKRDGKIG